LGHDRHLFTIGFLKKLAADPIATLIEPVWSSPGHYSSIALILALIGFSVQVYADFSGYTDMGRGIARMLGFRLPINFRAPYLAASPQEFFQRWHVSLSNWIRIFVYERLAMAVVRRIRNRRIQNYTLVIVVLGVMGLFGLWHGAAWKYVLFGLLLGVIITGWVAITDGKPARSFAGRCLGIIVMQSLWLLALILFRSDDIATASKYLAGMAFTLSPQLPANLWWCLLALVCTLIVQSVDFFVEHRPVARLLAMLRGTNLGLVATSMLLVVAVFVKANLDYRSVAASESDVAGSQPFIYFKF
jgi:alginate O-acetyltransferase complex protein AlgI